MLGFYILIILVWWNYYKKKAKPQNSHWFCVLDWPTKIPKELERYSDIRKYRKEFLKNTIRILKRLLNTKVIWGAPKPKNILTFSSFCHP